MFPCHAAVALQSIPTFKVSNNCRATESSPATNLKRGTTSRRSGFHTHAVRVRSSASFRLVNLAANIHPRCLRPMDFTKPSPGNAARVFDHHLYMYVMAALLCSQPLHRLCGVVTSRAPIPFSAHPRSIDGESSPDNLPLATGSGTKAMAEAMRAKKVAICLYMVAIEGEKLTGCWFGLAIAEREEEAKRQTRTPKPGGHCEIARKSSSCQHLLEAIRVSHRKRTSAAKIRPPLV